MIPFLVIGIVLVTLTILYGLIVLAALLGLARKGNRRSRPELPEPFITVIIPVRNEQDSIGPCLRSIVKQDYPPHLYSVIVSDDFSDDQTVYKASSFLMEQRGMGGLVVEGDPQDGAGRGKKGALLRAIEKSSGPLILTTDADTQRTTGWISAMVHRYRETGAKMIVGPVLCESEPTPFQRLQTLEFLGVMGLTIGFGRLGLPLMCNGANLCYENQAFQAAGGFEGNERFASGDDQFLLWKFRQRFGRGSIVVADDPAAVVSTPAAATLGQFFSQRLRWISKSKGYRDRLVLVTGAITFLFQSAIVSAGILGAIAPVYLYLAMALFGFKVLADLPLVSSMAHFFGKQRLMPWYLPAQIFQVLYVTVSVPLAFLVPVRWKGRRI